MTYRLGKTYADDLILLPGEVLSKIEEASDREIRILLYLAARLSHGAVEEEEILSYLSSAFDREEVLSALAFWRGCGVLKTDGKKSAAITPKAPKKAEEQKETKGIDADEAPFYTAADLATAAESQPDFKNLVSFAEKRLEKVMNQSELARLYSFLDYLKMPLDVVMLVIEDCASRDKKGLRYITKLLNVFHDEGIDSYEKAEEYFVRRKESALYENVVRRLFGLGTRKLSSAEETCVIAWREKFGYGEEMLDAAYEKTVSTAKNPTIKYMHKILESWHAAGITTPEEIDKVKAPTATTADKSYDLDDFFQQAVSKGRKDL